ncbi:MAG: HEAT repeat domain-containing protein, partial [Planctomycetota bacterium]|nr:HEAT repeat domain-containing protein [Planctomycetota bacterium]
TFANHDVTPHSLHSFTRKNERFNLVAAPNRPVPDVHRFTEKEPTIYIRCDLHPGERAWCHVLEHPFFDVTNDLRTSSSKREHGPGAFEIRNVPAGVYDVEAWHERLGQTSRGVVLKADEVKELNFVFDAAKMRFTQSGSDPPIGLDNAPFDVRIRLWIPQLLDDDTSNDADAARGLHLLRAEAAEFLPTLAKATREEGRIEAELVATALGRVGDDIESVVVLISECLNHKDKLIRGSALEILSKFGSHAKPAVLALVGALNHRDEAIRDGAADALAGLGADAKEAIPRLESALQDEVRLTRHRAARVLERIGPGAVPALIRTMRNDDPFIRWDAVEALANMGAGASEAVGALIEALDDEHWFIRRHAAKALGKIGPHAAPALPALERSTEDANEFVRKQAAEAIRRIQT